MQIKPQERWILHSPTIIGGFFLLYLYLGIQIYGSGDIERSALGWLKSAWNPETDYQHGIFIPFICFLLIYRLRVEISKMKIQANPLGIFCILFACLIYFAGHRTIQPRITLGALPFFLLGISLCSYGAQISVKLLFPLFFFLLSVPLPNFQQATTQLQILAILIAEQGTNLIGIETFSEGSTLYSAKEKWHPTIIGGGCSGIRSLIALFTFSSAWAYISSINLWKKIVFVLLAIPIAILGNSLRVISIFIFSEWVSPEFGLGFWHNWSGLLFFYPFSLFLLSLLNNYFHQTSKNK